MRSLKITNTSASSGVALTRDKHGRMSVVVSGKGGARRKLRKGRNVVVTNIGMKGVTR